MTFSFAGGGEEKQENRRKSCILKQSPVERSNEYRCWLKIHHRGLLGFFSRSSLTFETILRCYKMLDKIVSLLALIRRWIDLRFLFRRAIDRQEVASKLSLFLIGKSVSFGINGLRRGSNLLHFPSDSREEQPSL